MKNWKLLLVFGLIATLFVFAGCIAGTTTPEETPTATATATATATESATPLQQVGVLETPIFNVFEKGANDPDFVLVATFPNGGIISVNKAQADNGVKLVSSNMQASAESVEIFIDGTKLGDAEITNGTWEYVIKAADWGSDGTKTVSVRYVYTKKASYSNFTTFTAKVDTTAPTLSSAKVVEGIKGGLSRNNIYWTYDPINPDNVNLSGITVTIVDKTLVQDAMWTFTTYGSGGDVILKITKTDASGVSIITADYNLTQAAAVQGTAVIELPHTIMQGMTIEVDTNGVAVDTDYGKLWSRKEVYGYIQATFSEPVGDFYPSINIEGATYNTWIDADNDGVVDKGEAWKLSKSADGKTLTWTDNIDNYLWGKSGKYYVLNFSAFYDEVGNKGTATAYGYVLTQ